MSESSTWRLKLIQLGGEFAICQLEAGADLPTWAVKGQFSSITRTPSELSILCLREQVPQGIKCEVGWRVLQVAGPFEFDAIGVLASLTSPLAVAGISLLTVSTYDTDYIFIQEEHYSQAVQVLRTAGHNIQ